MPREMLESGGWVATETTVQTVFSLPTIEVRTATAQYEDEATRDALAEVTGHSTEISPRFFAGTRLTFQPPLPPGVSPTMVAPMLRTESQSTFTERLRERGVVDISRDGSQRMRGGGGNRATVTRYDAAIEMADLNHTVPLACWVAFWTTRTATTIVTGGHPQTSLAKSLSLETTDNTLTRSSESYRDEFFRLLRAVN